MSRQPERPKDKTEKSETARNKQNRLKSFNVPFILVEHGENRPPTEFYRKTDFLPLKRTKAEEESLNRFCYYYVMREFLTLIQFCNSLQNFIKGNASRLQVKHRLLRYG